MNDPRKYLGPKKILEIEQITWEKSVYCKYNCFENFVYIGDPIFIIPTIGLKFKIDKNEGHILNWNRSLGH